MTSPARYEARWSVEVGRLIIGQVEREIRRFLFDRPHLDRDVFVDKGWPTGYVYLTLRGKKDDVERAIGCLNDWVEELGR